MRPIEEGCGCPACQKYSRAYIRHLLKAKEMLGMRLCVMHNLYFYNTMMEEIRELISEGKTVSITAKGYSMNPFIRHLDDQITIGPYEDSQLKKGTAVLALTTTGNYVFHRIIERKDNRLILCGDGNVGITENATTEDVIGIMHSITRKGHEYSADSLTWKTYSWIWMLTRRFRRYPLAIWRRLNPQKPLR